MLFSPLSRFGLAALALACCVPAQAAGVVGTGTAVSCTEAALDAALAGGGTVTFNCGGAPVMLNLSTTKVLAADTTIDGSGNDIWLNGAGAVRHFTMTAPVNFTLRQIGLTNGYTANEGGAIYATGPSTLALTRVKLNSNRADGLGGGALFTTGGVTATLTQVDMIQNRGTTGAAIYTYNVNDALTLREVYAGDNMAANGGGAVRHRGRSLVIEASLFESNTATTLGATGGAVLAAPTAAGGSPVTIVNSTFVENKAGGGAVGGAVSLDNAPGSTITNSTFARNEGDGAIVVSGVSTLALKNTIVSASVGPNCNALGGATLTDSGNNLQFGGDTPLSCGAAVPDADPLLAASAANNGGTTRTMALLAGSPAIDAGSACPATDQRGYGRPTGPACDMGAFEAGAVLAGGGGGGSVAGVPALGPWGLPLLAALVGALGLRQRRRVSGAY